MKNELSCQIKYMSLKLAVTLILREELEIRVGMFFPFI